MPQLGKAHHIFPMIADAPLVEQPYLHFTTPAKDIVCRCNRPRRHERWYPVTEYEPVVEALALQHMEDAGSETCTKAEWRAVLKRNEPRPTKKQLFGPELHYTNEAKDMVCRCADPTRHLGRTARVRNDEIRILATQFFARNPTKPRCAKEEWRTLRDHIGRKEAMKAASAPVQHPASHNVTSSLERGWSTLDTRRWGSMQPTNVLASGKEWSKVLSELADDQPQVPDWMMEARHLSSLDPNKIITDQPPPSGPVYSTSLTELQQKYGRHSIILGNARADTDDEDDVENADHCASMRPVSLRKPPSAVHVSEEEHQEGSEAFLLGNTWVQSKELESQEDYDDYPEVPSISSLEEDISDIPGQMDRLSFNPWGPQCEGTARSARGAQTLPVMATVLEDDEEPEVRMPGSYPLKLPDDCGHASEFIAEMPALPAVQIESSEDIKGARSKREYRYSIRVEKKPASRIPVPAEKPKRMSALYDVSAPSRATPLPSQQAFLQNGVTVSSQLHCVPPAGTCKICKVPLHLQQNKENVQVACGHFIHKECLLEHFRCQDQELGSCPTCDSVLCERTLADRIDTDREALFGQQFTPLPQEAVVDSPELGEVVYCVTEEELAMTQLRILKAHLDSCMEDVWSWYQSGGGELDWYSMVRAALERFREDGLPVRQCRYLSNHDAFLKFVLWAELVRLMNNIRIAVRRLDGPDSPFPSLRVLHKKFLMARDRFTQEGVKWPRGRQGVAYCERVAKDAYDIAMKTLQSGW
ncbi:hypothetical protein BU26DRAFT_583759 [Trematosphaeria pertusa]|uniref:RING-type domain-containing protein n=1 Tax=Trematosphaeria pertusa TaxID=390896 RepID=A0A6A6IXM8_9PLEO|nr:uncharacterized protein BU26DRAFT_583759 [Trematosphaeria pertusa]KAF2255116.1 hypothetical protein BU26DRAFT_583759 [Trematosphaeria pertusa]